MLQGYNALAGSVDQPAIKKGLRLDRESRSGTRGVAPFGRTLAGNTAMLNVSLVFLDLMEVRHRADYEHNATCSKPAALRPIDDAETVAPNQRL